MKKGTRRLTLSGLTGSLANFLTLNLKGSSLKVSEVSPEELLIEADRYMRVRVLLSPKKSEITYDVYSPEWKRPVRVEELGGFDYMEAKIEEDLLKMEMDRSIQDTLLAVDLLRMWSKKNKRKLVETVEESPI